jgi:hypothetical protein
MARWLAALLLAPLALARPSAACAEAPKPERLRISLLGGAGYANEHASNATYGAGVLAVVGRVGGAQLGLALETLSSYDRTYLSTLPAADGDGRLAVQVTERMPRARISAGWDLLSRYGVAYSGGALVPYLLGELLDFANDTFPQRASSLGGGLWGELRVHGGLALLLDLAYVKSLHVSGASAHPLLLYGPFDGGFRMMFGAAFAIAEQARFELRYQGELLFNERDTRVLDTLLVGPTFFLR